MSPSPAPTTVGIITALPVECAAMLRLVDPAPAHTAPGDVNHYYLGQLPSSDPDHPHRLVVAVLAEDGTRSASALSADLLRSFPDTRCVIMAGIAGGVPTPGHPHHHVRLGDIVVGTDGVIDDGHIRLVNGHSELRRTLGGVSPDLRLADRALEIAEHAGRRPWEAWLGGDAGGFARPPAATDILHADGVPVPHPDDTAYGRRPGFPRVHRGAIASADRLLRDAAHRDALARHHRILAVEMESSGIAVAAATRSVGWLTVRGIADYCDESTKNDVWHPYASLAAAGYVRALLAACHPFGVRSAPPRSNGHPEELSADRLRQIVQALLNIEQIRDDADRRALLSSLPPNIASAVPHNARPYLHVYWLVKTCTQFRAGSEALLNALSLVVPAGAPALDHAVQLIERYWPAAEF